LRSKPVKHHAQKQKNVPDSSRSNSGEREVPKVPTIGRSILWVREFEKFPREGGPEVERA